MTRYAGICSITLGSATLSREKMDIHRALFCQRKLQKVKCKCSALFTTLKDTSPEEDKYIAREVEKYCYAYFVRTEDNEWLMPDSEENPCCPY